MDFLSAVWKERPGGPRFLDLEINGESLAPMFGSDQLDLVACLGWCRPDADDRFRSELLGLSAASLPDNRVMIYICPQCGDIGCGAITANVQRIGDDLIWSNFAHHNNHSPALDPAIGYFSAFPDAGPYRFSFNQCAQALSLK